MIGLGLGLGFSSFLDGFRPLSDEEQDILKGKIDDSSIKLIEAIKDQNTDEKDTDNGDETNNNAK